MAPSGLYQSPYPYTKMGHMRIRRETKDPAQMMLLGGTKALANNTKLYPTNNTVSQQPTDDGLFEGLNLKELDKSYEIQKKKEAIERVRQGIFNDNGSDIRDIPMDHNSQQYA